MNIKLGYYDLVNTIDASYTNLELLYELDLNLELSEKNNRLRQNLIKAIEAFTDSVEDQVIVAAKEVGETKSFELQQSYFEEHYQNHKTEWSWEVDGDLDEHIGESL